MDGSSRKPCPVPGCLRTYPSQFAMCRRHWDESPAFLRQKIVNAYRSGEEARKWGLWPTPIYLSLVNEAVLAVVRQREIHAVRRSPEVEKGSA